MCRFENKIVKKIGLLYCAKYLLSKLFLDYIYFPYIHSYLNYVNISWASTYQIKLKAIHQLQKWALRSIFNENNMTLSRPLLQSVNDLYVYQINLFQHLHFIYNFNKNETPINFNNLIKKIFHMHPTKFRKNSFNLKTFFVNGSKYCICTKFLIQSN